ncbi:response regulator transcription factor [Aerococcaceae bacterium NML190938]|nr:response regulator transcription factor [Aerococcaceae bacterium NML190938]
MVNIMIVEDDPIIQQTLASALIKWGYEVIVTTQFDNIMEDYHTYLPQLIILDITLPLYNGYHWCQELRKVSNVPILFLSSHNQPVDIVMAINLGADDFITKPFDVSVLIAKVRGLLRRSYEFTSEVARLEHQQVVLDLKATTLSYHHKTIDLTRNEFQIMRVLFENVGTFVSRDTLMTQLWNSDIFIDDNTLTVNVARLRRKLADIGLEDFITTKKGIGYGLVMPHE